MPPPNIEPYPVHPALRYQICNCLTRGERYRYGIVTISEPRIQLVSFIFRRTLILRRSLWCIEFHLKPLEPSHWLF